MPALLSTAVDTGHLYLHRDRDWTRAAAPAVIQDREIHQDMIEVTTWGSRRRSFIGGLCEVRWSLAVPPALIPAVLRADQIYFTDAVSRHRWFGFVVEASPERVVFMQTHALPAFIPPKWGAPGTGRGYVTYLGYWEDAPDS